MTIIFRNKKNAKVAFIMRRIDYYLDYFPKHYIYDCVKHANSS